MSSPITEILRWAVFIMPCPHIRLGFDPAFVGADTTNICPFCGPVKVKWWPE